MTHTQYCGRRVDGEKCSNSYIKTVVKNQPRTQGILLPYWGGQRKWPWDRPVT